MLRPNPLQNIVERGTGRYGGVVVVVIPFVEDDNDATDEVVVVVVIVVLVDDEEGSCGVMVVGDKVVPSMPTVNKDPLTRS